MAGKLISQATKTNPQAGDMVPLARPGDTTARYMEYVASSVSVDDYGAEGDGTTDDTAAIQAAIDSGVLLDNSYGVVRYGRVVVKLTPGKIYKTTAPLDLCNKEGITLDGGTSSFGAIIHCAAAGKAAIEMIGSQYTTIQNLQIFGDGTNIPSVGIYVSRSGETGGNNAKRNYIRGVHFNGTYANASIYVVDVDSLFFHDCNVEAEGADAAIYLTSYNALGLIPEHATLLGAGYGMYGPMFYNCHIFGATATAVYCNTTGGACLTFRDCFIWGNSDTNPTVVFEGFCNPVFDNVGFEGTPGTRVYFKYKSGTVNYFQGSFRNIVWYSAKNYQIYAEDSTTLRNIRFDGYHYYSTYLSLYAPMSIYTAEQCDFSGLGYYYQGGVFAITVRYSARGCHFVLGPSDTVTFSGIHVANIIEYRSDVGANTYWEFESGMLKTGNYTWNGGHLMMGIIHLWVDASGRLRIKASAPTSDTDGTIVGTQS